MTSNENTSGKNKSGGDPGQGDDGGAKTGLNLDMAYALLIGIGRCSYPEWSLPVTVRDVEALRKVLVDPGHCAYRNDERHIRVLTDENATRGNILAELEDLASIAAKEPEATVVVCYTGHGWAADGDRYFLIPHDVKPHQLTATALPAEEFIAGLRSIRARRLLVLLDTCHAEAMATAKGSVPLLPDGFRQEPLPKSLAEELKDVRELSEGEGRAVFTSCLQEQKSWILENDSLSIFTHYLIEALKGAGNSPNDRFVMVSNLMNYVSREVKTAARKMNQEQTPFVMFETQDFPVALIRGGTRDQDDQGANHQGEGRESRTYNVHSGRDSIFARDVGSIRTGDSTSSDR